MLLFLWQLQNVVAKCWKKTDGHRRHKTVSFLCDPTENVNNTLCISWFVIFKSCLVPLVFCCCLVSATDFNINNQRNCVKKYVICAFTSLWCYYLCYTTSALLPGLSDIGKFMLTIDTTTLSTYVYVSTFLCVSICSINIISIFCILLFIFI